MISIVTITFSSYGLGMCGASGETFDCLYNRCSTGAQIQKRILCGNKEIRFEQDVYEKKEFLLLKAFQL